MPSPRKKQTEEQNDIFTEDLYLGIDIGASNLKYGILDAKGNIVYQRSQSTNANKGLEYMLVSLKRLIMTLQSKFPKIKAIGVGVPGIVYEDGTVKISPNMPEWVDVPLGKFLTNVFAIPVIIENDANCAAYAEMVLGAGKDFNSFIYVTLGTGVGGSIVYKRKIFKGEHNAAGEFGHIIYNPFEPLNTKRPFRTGIIEEYIGKNQLTSFAKKYIKDKPESILHKYEKTDPYFISDAVEKGDDVAIDILRHMGHILGIGLVTAMNLLDINIAIIGGGVSLAPDHYIESAIQTIKERALPHIAETAQVVRAQFTKDSGFIGSALLAKDYGQT
ncbi:MAG: ROK family protein [Ignavibacteria bacterium]|nr:ROK family protein [Ignavibacteria bacterium]